MTEKLTFTA